MVSDQILEFLGKEGLSGFDVPVAACEVWEMLADGCFAGQDFFAEEIHFVEEEDECGFLEVFAIRYAFEKHERFMHLVLK